jgi:hypothetical protein
VYFSQADLDQVEIEKVHGTIPELFVNNMGFFQNFLLLSRASALSAIWRSVGFRVFKIASTLILFDIIFER